ncbi:hypothetical protein [Serratia entomophila]|uniref:hypothetical protein n=1 Tax=Serratia entomophila TaxID=42906 RepID=UPI0021BB9DCA|nr:hypothetical protein [Serratia entomophila]
MEILDPSMFDSISGGRGNNGGDRVDNGGRNNSRNNGRGAPKTATNDAAGLLPGLLQLQGLDHLGSQWQGLLQESSPH